VPLDWAAMQNNLGTALSTLGERESGTARLEEAVSAFRDALQEGTREVAKILQTVWKHCLQRRRLSTSSSFYVSFLSGNSMEKGLFNAVYSTTPNWIERRLGHGF
jgi:hypothetical protein